MNTQSHDPPPIAVNSRTTRSTDWYAEGESRVVQVGELQIVVTFLGTKGRRARVLIEAPVGAQFEER